MKKRFISVIFALFVLLNSAFTVFAQSQLLVDDAELLTEDEYSYISGLLESAGEMQDASFVIVTVESTDGKGMMEYADDFFDYGGYRYDGILFLIDMERGGYWLSTCGKYDTYEVNSDVLDIIENDVRDCLYNGDFYGAFSAFAKDCYEIDSLYSEDSGDSEGFDVSGTLLVAFVIGIIVAFVVTSGMKSQLKNVKLETRAANYVVDGSMNITESRDLFLYHHITRTPRPKSNNSSGSSHRSSSGRSHGGRGGSFR